MQRSVWRTCMRLRSGAKSAFSGSQVDIRGARLVVLTSEVQRGSHGVQAPQAAEGCMPRSDHPRPRMGR
eukprot:1184149-Amphidinium_carterae.1